MTDDGRQRTKGGYAIRCTLDSTFVENPLQIYPFVAKQSQFYVFLAQKQRFTQKTNPIKANSNPIFTVFTPKTAILRKIEAKTNPKIYPTTRPPKSRCLPAFSWRAVYLDEDGFWLCKQ
jgi:hypothetical protein